MNIELVNIDNLTKAEQDAFKRLLKKSKNICLRGRMINSKACLPEVMLSVQRQWCDKIASGKKTMEVRKTRPTIPTPFKVYIYETKFVNRCKFEENNLKITSLSSRCFQNKYSGGKVIGEFVCDRIDKFSAEFTDGDCYEDIRYYEDTDDELQAIIIAANDNENPNDCFLCKESCLSFNDIKKYIGLDFHEKAFYGWQISKLIIYDKPKELSLFGLQRPPQSWCYVK